MNASILGVGMTRFSRSRGTSAEELAAEAIMAAIRHAGVSHNEIGAAYAGSLYAPPGLGQRVLKDLGINGIAISNVENACSTGTDAFIHAARLVVSGEVRTALAFGVDTPTAIAASGMLPLTPGDPSLKIGITAPAIYAMRANRYIETFGATPADLAAVTVKSRRHASENEYALFRNQVTVDEVLNSPLIASPITRLQSCPISDGAAAIVVGRGAPGLARVAGWALRSGTPQDCADAGDTVTKETAAQAYEMAGLGPEDVDLCEVHDAFTIGELLALESLGLCARGEAGRAISRGKFALGANGLVANPSGGLLARGHPPGATGLAQLVEASLQVAGAAKGRQVAGARNALCHTRGGGSFDLDANVCGTVILTTDAAKGRS